MYPLSESLLSTPVSETFSSSINLAVNAELYLTSPTDSLAL